ncbi:hypothetical protein O181_039923 [Austropuccinia psidii MF-1]|uniref:Uncharacterized protein n=1 Tax=Austropuccinia psidii MF-1 TaxID=1389203 RepID=A0A9Q3DEB9_9BASI|nr:hypothetical protein [Austropuccinia psidii MF-1]
MYHNGTNWSFPSVDSQFEGQENREREHWQKSLLLSGESVIKPSFELISPNQSSGSRVSESQSGIESIQLTPRAVLEHEVDLGRASSMSEFCSHSPIGMVNKWGKPRLTFRPASIDDRFEDRLEYRSSDDEDDDEDESRRWRWKGSGDGSHYISSQTSRASGVSENLCLSPCGPSKENDDDDDEASNTLQIEVKRRKRGASKSEGS